MNALAGREDMRLRQALLDAGDDLSNLLLGIDIERGDLRPLGHRLEAGERCPARSDRPRHHRFVIGDVVGLRPVTQRAARRAARAGDRRTDRADGRGSEAKLEPRRRGRCARDRKGCCQEENRPHGWKLLHAVGPDKLGSAPEAGRTSAGAPRLPVNRPACRAAQMCQACRDSSPRQRR